MRKPPAERSAELIGQEIDGFLFVEKVASGASSTVYRALQRPVDDRLVAVKVLDAVEQRLLLAGHDDLNPLWREARFSQTVRHPAIVRIFTTGRLPDGRYYVAMEFVDGHTLEEELRLRGPVGETEMLDLTGQIAAAVACLHDKRIVHRDLKPSNLILRATGAGHVRVKLIDFGQAKLAHHRDDWSTLGEENLPGTPGYMAPEQARGQGTRYTSDVYAIGAIAYEILTGKPVLALKRPTVESCLAYLRSDRPLPTIPLARIHTDSRRGVTELVERCLSRDPSRRPGSAGELRALLDGWIQEPSAESPGPLQRVLGGLWSKDD